MYPSLFWINRWISRNGYRVKKNSEHPNVFILGENHDIDEMATERKRFVLRLNPEFYLSEPSGSDIGAKVLYVPSGVDLPEELRDELIDQVEWEIKSPCSHIKEDLDTIAGTNAVLVGCDLDFKTMFDQGVEILQEMFAISVEKAQEKYFSDFGYDWDVRFARCELRADREKVMAATINHYVKFASNTPLVVYLGAGHINADSVLYDHLDPKVKYWAIDQTGEELPKPI
jgi:hypothetical protein